MAADDLVFAPHPSVSSPVRSPRKLAGLAALWLVASACGGAAGAGATAGAASPEEEAAASASADAGTGMAGDPAAPKKDECSGAAIANLEDVLMKSACEVDTSASTTAAAAGGAAAAAKPDVKPADPKALDIKLDISPIKVTPGGHATLTVVITNKTKDPLPLLFTIDPLPRFDVEAYDSKGTRVDIPKANPPPLPANVAARVPGDPHTARVVILANGTARMPLGWDAVKMKWAPEKLRGSPPEKGYPRTPAGPLPKGTYTLKVVVPIVGVFEGFDHEVSQPRGTIDVAK